MANNSLQFSLRSLLWVTTILAVCLAFVPQVTLVCLFAAAGVGTALTVIELTIHFRRAFSCLVAVWFFAIGVGGLGLVVAIAFDEVEGYTPALKWFAVIIFGPFACFGFWGAACAMQDLRAISDSAGNASIQGPDSSQVGGGSDEQSL
jgi:hypothetical protein